MGIWWTETEQKYSHYGYFYGSFHFATRASSSFAILLRWCGCDGGVLMLTKTVILNIYPGMT